MLSVYSSVSVKCDKLANWEVVWEEELTQHWWRKHCRCSQSGAEGTVGPPILPACASEHGLLRRGNQSGVRRPGQGSRPHLSWHLKWGKLTCKCLFFVTFNNFTFWKYLKSKILPGKSCLSHWKHTNFPKNVQDLVFSKGIAVPVSSDSLGSNVLGFLVFFGCGFFFFFLQRIWSCATRRGSRPCNEAWQTALVWPCAL